MIRGERPALVVVDFSRGFTEAGFPTGADLTAEVESTTRLVEAAHRQGIPVAFTVISFHPTLLMRFGWRAKVRFQAPVGSQRYEASCLFSTRAAENLFDGRR